MNRKTLEKARATGVMKQLKSKATELRDACQELVCCLDGEHRRAADDLLFYSQDLPKVIAEFGTHAPAPEWSDKKWEALADFGEIRRALDLVRFADAGPSKLVSRVEVLRVETKQLFWELDSLRR